MAGPDKKKKHVLLNLALPLSPDNQKKDGEFSKKCLSLKPNKKASNGFYRTIAEGHPKLQLQRPKFMSNKWVMVPVCVSCGRELSLNSTVLCSSILLFKNVGFICTAILTVSLL